MAALVQIDRITNGLRDADRVYLPSVIAFSMT